MVALAVQLTALLPAATLPGSVSTGQARKTKTVTYDQLKLGFLAKLLEC